MSAEWILAIIEVIECFFICCIFIYIRGNVDAFDMLNLFKRDVVDELEDIQKQVIAIEDRLTQIDRHIGRENHMNH